MISHGTYISLDSSKLHKTVHRTGITTRLSMRRVSYKTPSLKITTAYNDTKHSQLTGVRWKEKEGGGGSRSGWNRNTMENDLSSLSTPRRSIFLGKKLLLPISNLFLQDTIVAAFDIQLNMPPKLSVTLGKMFILPHETLLSFKNL